MAIPAVVKVLGMLAMNRAGQKKDSGFGGEIEMEPRYGGQGIQPGQHRAWNEETQSYVDASQEQAAGSQGGAMGKMGMIYNLLNMLGGLGGRSRSKPYEMRMLGR